MGSVAIAASYFYRYYHKGKVLYLKVSSYSLTVLAADGGVPARFGSLSVDIRVSDVTDDGPRFDHVTYDVTVEENAPPMTVVTSVRATSDQRDASIEYAFDDETARRYGQVRFGHGTARHGTAPYGPRVTSFTPDPTPYGAARRCTAPYCAVP